MFVSIFGLPPNVKYQDLKSLIKQQCNLIDIIIDNIVSTPDGTKKVRIGLADDGEAMRLVKGLDGYRLQGNHVIKVVPVGKTQPNPSQQGFDSQQYPPRNEFATNQGGDYRGSQRAPMDSMNRSQPWGPGGQNVWSQESPMAPVPQNNFGYTQGYAQQPAFHPQRPDAPYAQGRPMIDQYGSKPNVPDNRRNVEARSHVLRNIEIVDSPAINQPPTQGRYPPGQGYQQHDKPGAIKDPLRVPTRWEGMANQQGPGHYQAHGELQPWNHQRKPSPGREPGRMMQGRPISPRHGRPISPSRPGLHGRQSPGRPISPRHRMSPERPGRMGRPGSPRQAGRMESGVPGRHSGRPGSPKNYPDLGRPTDGRPGTTGRHMSPGRQHGRPGSPPNRQPGGRPIPSGKGSPPGRHHMRPGSPGMRSSGRPGSPGIRHSGRPGSPGMRPGRPISPGMRPSGRPGSPSMRHSGRPESPGMRSGRPISPGMRLPGRPGSPGMRPSGRPGSPGMRASGRPGSPNMRPSGRSGSPGLRPSGRPGSPGMRPPGRPGSPGMRPPGRPISPGPRTIQEQRPGMGRPGSPGMRLGRPGSPRKLDTFSGRAISPDGRPLPDQRPRMGRPGSPVMFVSGRSGSPGRRLSPHHRPGRPGSPPGRNLSPHSRIPGAPRRTISPNQRRLGDRGDSPRRMSPHRYSPDRHHPDKNDQFDTKFKLTRPAYDSMASSKGMYSSAFRPNVPWQKDDKYPKIDDDRREGRIPPRAIEADKRILSTERKSRSPGRRDRSPLKDRFKRHSPSPRSPRRSWALEKRRSPEIREAPPPPVWPGQKRNDDQFGRRNIPDRMEKEEKGKHVPVWELHSDSKDIERRRESRLEQNDRRFEEKGDRRDILNRELRNERFALQNERPDTYSPKFSPREIDDRREFRLNDEKRFSERQARRDFQRRSVDRENRHRDELARQRNASPQHMDEQSIRRNFDKELEDIYKRAVEFRKKTEELRRSGERRREGYTEEDNSVMAYERSRRPKSPDQRDYKKSPLHERRPRSKEKVKAEWKVEQKPNLPEHVKAKREKALKEIMKRLLERQTVCDYLEGEFETRVRDELKLEISKIIQTLFGNEDVSFIEIIIKYQAKFTLKDEELMLQAVLNSLPKPNLKRSGPEISEGAAKTARRSSPTAIKESARAKLSEATTVNWTANIEPPKLATVSALSTPLPNSQIEMVNPLGMSQFGVMQQLMLLGDNHPAMAMSHHLLASQMAIHIGEQIKLSHPAMVPAPYDPAVENKSEQSDQKGQYNLYICHEDFQPFTSSQADKLKQFLFLKIVEVTESSRGWAPDITIKGLQSLFRYELQTKDFRSRDWLLNLDFSGFNFFNVVIYTKEELWYERAAIWLPGHSKSNIEPLDKLKLQNKQLNDINIGKWKMVKKIVNDKGTRLFVDMPPASARALEKYKMMLSYELQKVNVFLRAAAVDKDAFDSCMRELSISDKTVTYKAAQNAPFPVINNDPALVKITLKDSQTLSIEETRKIKEVVIYHIFRYHQMNGTSRTDFVRHGFCKPNYFGVVPDNIDSKKWLLSRNFGKLKNNEIIVVGGDEDESKMFAMKIIVDSGYSINASKILERLKSSNQGVKGIYFNRWKVDQIARVIDDRMVGVELKIDIDSLEALKHMKYQLDYVTDRNETEVVTFKSAMPVNKLEEDLKKYKTEAADSYDVANMELDSEDENVICLD